MEPRISRAGGLRRFPLHACALAILLLPTLAGAAWIDLGGEPVAVRLLEDDGSRSVIEITVGGFQAEPVMIDGQPYYLIDLPREGLQKEVGLPQLPNIRRSVIIPDDREMAVRVLESEHVDLADMPVAPSKGYLPRTVDPATVPYIFADFYASDDVYPREIAQADPPYILRDYRGLVVDANVFQYDAAARSLRVYTRLVLEVVPVGPGRVNVLERHEPVSRLDRQFANLYREHFVNYGTASRYTPLLEDGSLLIIAYDAYAGFLAPLVEWKNQKGLPTRLVTLSETGPTYTQIFNYIQLEYQSTDLAYVLLIGDAQHIPRYGSDSDPGYALLAGSDSYPEIFVGRFSAETPEHVQTQVARTIAYERDVAAGSVSQWLQHGTGIASNQGPGHFGEYDNVHMGYIRNDLLGYGYLTVDEIYDPTATAAMVSNALNAGRGIVNYCGHGSSTSWGTTGFSNTSVNALVNDEMLPFILSVACNNGTFSGGTCFAEAWLRATNGGVPTGAVACYMSYISQSWDPPMYAQDEATDLLVGDVMRTIGGLWFNGSCEMMDATGAIGMTEFRNWTIFGDPSLTVRTKVAEELAANHTGVLLIGLDEYEVDVPGVEGALCALYADGVLYGAALTDAFGHAVIAMATPPMEPMTLTLTVTAYNKVALVEEVPVLPPEGPYLVYDSVTVDDSLGDVDGELDYGEVAGIYVTLENVGVEGATGITATMASFDPNITVEPTELIFPDIAPGGTGTSESPCPVVLAGNIPDGYVIPLQLHIAADNGIWDTAFSVAVQAPVLSVADVVIDDTSSGDGDGIAEAGEGLAVMVHLANTGHAATQSLTGILSSADGDVIITMASARGDGVPVDGVAELGVFGIEILPECPEPSYLLFQLAVEDPVGYTVALDFEVMVGGWYDDLERDRGWTAGAPGDDATSGIWTCADP